MTKKEEERISRILPVTSDKPISCALPFGQHICPSSVQVRFPCGVENHSPTANLPT